MIERSASFVLGLTLLLLGSVGAQTPGDSASRARDATIRALQAGVRRTTSLEAFGRGIERQAVLAAASQLKAGKPSAVVVQVPVRVEIFPLPGPVGPTAPGRPSHNPNDVDVCYELSSSVDDYIKCTAPNFVDVDIRPIRIVNCDDLWAQYEAAEGSLKFVVLQELLDNGCLDWTRVRITILR